MPTKKLKVHFIGIGGIGVSALAQYYLKKGYKVSGSDLVSSEITDALKKKGAKIFIGQHKKKNVPKDVNLIIHSPAVQKNNPELNQHRVLIKQPRMLSYPEALGELTKEHFTIAISGTHGKSTTTTMIGLLLTKAGFDPTVIVGTKVKEFNHSNCRVGKSKYLIIEADEHFASFLNYWPKIIVLTSIEKDHLDYYKNLNNILKTFKKYISHLPEDGILVANKNDKNIHNTLKKYIGPTYVYSLKQKEVKKLRKILKVPGEHNIANALAALTVARTLKIPDKVSFKALSEYRGSWRRFEETQLGKLKIISDYAHHPTEIKVTLKAARAKYPKKKIWCVFQPHQHQRTYYLFDDFVKVFRQAPVDKLIITDIYDVAGREEKKLKKKITSEKLTKAVNRKKIIYLPTEKLLAYIKENLSPIDVLIIMGAGDIYKLVDSLRLTEKRRRKKIK